MLHAFADLVLPRRCAGCGMAGDLLCPRCRPAGPAAALLRSGVPVRAEGWYARGLRAALLAYKEHGRRELGRPLGDMLSAAVGAPAVSEAVLVPVPSSRQAIRRRGGDHVLRLARRAGRCCRLPVVRALRLARPVSDSAGLGSRERVANLAGAMAALAAPAGVAGAGVIVVDDIVTSGTTLAEAARALRAAGWPVIGAAVIAATPWRGPPGAGCVPLPGFGSASPRHSLCGHDAACLPSGTSAHTRLALS